MAAFQSTLTLRCQSFVLAAVTLLVLSENGPMQAAEPSVALETMTSDISNGLVTPSSEDRIWLLSTRSISSSACRANLDSFEPRVSRIDACGRRSNSSLEEFLVLTAGSPRVVFYVHGNRMDASNVISRSMVVYRRTKKFGTVPGMDWVIWSWPSEQEGILGRDVRTKAARTDAQGLYLAKLLRDHSGNWSSTSAIGFSFGARVVTGALHAMAGGKLGGRRLPGPPQVGLRMDVGLIAAAIENHWLMNGQYHGLATQNMDRLTVLYNRRDAVLKRYWLIDRVRGQMALGFTGPLSFARREDGTRLPVRSRDCATFVGLQHSEVDYYDANCSAGRQMASLIRDTSITH